MSLLWRALHRVQPSGLLSRRCAAPYRGRILQTSRQSLRFASNNVPKPSTVIQADKIISKLPKPLQKYGERLRNAPVSHVVAFLILHEITAVVPLLGLFAVFHYTTYVPLGYVVTNYGSYVTEGTKRFEKYFTKKGWFGFGGEATEDTWAHPADHKTPDITALASRDVRYQILLEVGLAYAITKALLPLRIMASLWATPWAAGLMAKTQRFIRPR